MRLSLKRTLPGDPHMLPRGKNTPVLAGLSSRRLALIYYMGAGEIRACRFRRRGAVEPCLGSVSAEVVQWCLDGKGASLRFAHQRDYASPVVKATFGFTSALPLTSL